MPDPNPGLQSVIGIASARDTKPRMAVNKACKLQGGWNEVNVTEPCFIKSIASTPSVLWYIDGDAQPTTDRITETSLYPGLSGVGYFSHPGRWWFYFVQSGSSPVDECYVIQPVTDPISALLFWYLQVQAMSVVDVRKWGGTLINGATTTGGQAQNEGIVGPMVRAQLAALDTSQAAASQSQALQSRQTGATQTTLLERLLTDSVLRANDPLNGVQSLVSVAEETSGGGAGALLTADMRESGYWTSRRGRRYVCKSPNLTGVAAATGLTTTAPTFLIVAGASKEVIVRRITISMPLKGTSTTFRALVKTDTANRYSSGGTARAAATLNNGNAVASGLAKNHEAPTASAEGGGTLDVGAKAGLVSDGATIEFLWKDGLFIPASGSLLLYLVTATAGATCDYEIEFEEVDVQ